MARVNHKKVKQLIQQKRGKITDQEFFTSRLLGLHFEDVAAAQTKRYGASRRVRVHLIWQPESSDLLHRQFAYHHQRRESRRHRIPHPGRAVSDGTGAPFAHELGHLPVPRIS